jgi:Zn-dependent protease
MEATVLPPPPAPPDIIHSCPQCSHWLPDGTLACPDCQTLTYGQHLGRLAAEAQELERLGRWAEAREVWRAALPLLPPDTKQNESIVQHIGAINRRLDAEEDRKARWTRRLGPFAPIAFFLLKAKSALFFLFKLKFLLSMFAFFAVYWALFGWQFALGFTASIFVHEMGHYITLKRRGLQADLPFFLPGFGAWVRWYNLGVSREDLAAISLAGPLYGLGTALACLALFWGTHGELFLVLANVIAWLNLLNLIPILGLDGARAVFALSRLQRVLIGLTAVIFFAITAGRNPMDLGDPANHFIFLFIAGGMTWRCFTPDTPDEPHTGTLTYFLGVMLVLGLVLHLSGVGLTIYPNLRNGFNIH